MPKVLDLNNLTRPTLELTLQDEQRTTVRLTTPTEAMVQELSALTPAELNRLKNGDRESVEFVYNLAARLISCNLDFLTVTADELRSRYRMDLYSAVVFFNAYLDFINEIANAKN